MGIFSDNVRKYFEHGLFTIPCKDKAPILGQNWQRFCEEKPDTAHIDRWEAEYKNANQLGLVLGKSTLLSGFDFDYEFHEKKCTLKPKEFEKDRLLIERQILALLPPSPAIKTGRKGWTRFYRSHGDLENAQCDRNGLRLFDFLARNKQTIIPPSKYSDDGDLHYRWLGPAIEDCLDDIPYITQDIIHELKLVMGDTQGFDFEASGRHGILFKWLLDVVKIERNNKLVADKLIQFDVGLNQIPYLSDPKHFPRHKTTEQNAIAWITRVRKFVGEGGAKQIKLGNHGWDYFFENAFHQIKKDIISKKCFFKLNAKSEWSVMDDVDGVLRSYADRRGLTTSKTRDEFDRWVLEKEKTDFLCDIPPWDGVDRISQYGKEIQSPDFTSDEISDILRHWGSNIFRRVKSANTQNRCIIFKGAQGLGKDSLVRTMLEDFKPYYESTTLTGTQKDALEICSRLLVLHIEEFEQTKGLDIAFLKSLITQPSAFFRESYGASPNQKIMRPSFISTANSDDILRDPTGNRRFIVVPVTGVTWNYPTNCSLLVMAQFKAYFEAKQFEKLSDEIEKKIKAIVDSFTPESISVAVLDIYLIRFTKLTVQSDPLVEVPFPGLNILNGAQITPMLTDIAKMLGCHLKTVQSAVKAAGLSHRFRDGTRYARFTDHMRHELAKPPSPFTVKEA